MINLINNPIIILSGTLGIFFILFLIFKKRFLRDWKKSIFYEKAEFIIFSLIFLMLFVLGVFQVPFNNYVAVVCGILLVGVILFIIHTKKIRKKINTEKKTLEEIYGMKLDKPEGRYDMEKQ